MTNLLIIQSHSFFVRSVARIGLLLMLFNGIARECAAQMPMFSQYFSAPLYLNPALAGISVGPRVSVNYRNQWPSLGNGFNGGFSTYSAGTDLHVDALHGGLGIYMLGDQVANGILSAHSVTAMYSFQTRFKKKVGMKIGIEGTYINRKLKYSDLLLYDMIDPYTGFYNQINVPNPTAENVPPNLSTHTGDMGAGIVIFTEKIFWGAAVKNLLGNNESFYGKRSKVPFKLSTHLGGTIRFTTITAKRNNIYLSPSVVFEYQNGHYMINGGAIAGVSLAYFGVNYRHVVTNSDAIIGVVGIKKGKFRFGYSYDYTMGPLMGKTGGAHELSFTFNWSGDDNSLNPKRNRAYIECPEILNF